MPEAILIAVLVLVSWFAVADILWTPSPATGTGNKLWWLLVVVVVPVVGPFLYLLLGRPRNAVRRRVG